MVRLLNQADWGEDRGRIQRLKGWVYYPLLLEAYDTLQEVIGIRESKCSLKEYGVTYAQANLKADGTFQSIVDKYINADAQ